MNFKKALALLLVIACIFTMLASCGDSQKDEPIHTDGQSEEAEQTEDTTNNTTPDIDIDDEEETVIKPDVELKNLGEDIIAAGINNGKFDENTSSDFTVTYVSGTENAYNYDESTKTLTFNALSADSVYSVSGKLNGSIVINVGENYKLDLQLAGISLRSASASPITVNSAKEVTLSANGDTKSYIYDERAAVSENSSAIISNADLTVCGKGELFLQSSQNNGIQSLKNLQITDLALVVECKSEALNGKNSVTLKNCSTLLVARSGDAIKTEATDISESTNQQNGTVTVLGGTHNIFASNDGIDAAYDVIVDYGSITDETEQKTKIINTILNIYTDKYSTYTDATAHDKPELVTRPIYVCSTNAEYKYSVKLSTADGAKSEWVDPTFHEKLVSGRRTYYTYKFYVKPEYTKMTVYAYSKDQALQNEETYAVKSNLVDIDTKSDTYRYSSRRWEWKTYESLSQSGGSNTTANPNKVSYSAVGIKGTNSVIVKAGTIQIGAVDNAIYTNNNLPLDNKKAPTGDIIINGGDIMVISKCNGIHSSGALSINDGVIKILEAFDGILGATITVNNGDVSVTASNNGFNSTTKTGTGITVADGSIYVNAGAHGISASSTASYTAIMFNGGDIAIIATAAKKSPIYSDGGYTYSDGRIFAIMSQEGTRADATHYYSFSSVGKFQEMDLTENTYATVIMDDETVVSVKVPTTLSATVIYIGDKIAEISSASSVAEMENDAKVYWRE